MVDPGTATLIAAGIGLTASGGSAYAQGKMNKKTRQWNEKMYGIQRKDALADWTRQTDYDSPTSQMARLRAGGLNPNLVYGSGGGTQQAPPVRSTDVKQWSPQAPKIDASQVGDEVSRYYNIKATEATIDNLKQQNTLIIEQALLAEAQKNKVIAETPGVSQDIVHKAGLFPGQMDAQKADLNQKLVNIKHTMNQTEINIAQSSQSIEESIQRIINYRIQNAKSPHEISLLQQGLINAKHDTTIKELDAKLASKNIRPGDPFHIRLVQEGLNKIREAPKFKIPPLKFKSKADTSNRYKDDRSRE